MFPALGSAAPEHESFPAIEAVAGTVLTAESRWNARGDRIYTHSVIRTSDGTTVAVRQPGGSVGDIGMRQYPGPPLLRPGDRVELRAARFATTRSVLEVTSMARAPRAPTGPGAGAESRALVRQPGTLDYVRTTTEEGVPLYWASGCVYITYDSAGTSHVPGEQEFPVMDAALAHWRESVQGCSYMDFVVEEPRADLEVGFDGVNLVKFRDDRWCRPVEDENGEPAGEECHDPNAAGLTTLTFINNPESERYGEIVDADIELNGAIRFAISVDGESAGPSQRCLADLANTFTHEVGHLLGLDHTCRFSGEPLRLDHEGNEVPMCSDTLPPEILDATMHPSQMCGETKKSTLEADDVAAICAVYPLAEEPGRCAPVDLTPERSWCAAAPGGDGSRRTPAGVMALLLCSIALVWRLRRRGPAA